MKILEPVRVRFAPSPTGKTHLGSARTALYNFLLARQTSGQFILRLEDTDQRRYVPGADNELMNSLRWLGLEWDEGPDIGGPYGPYRQSERRELYEYYIQELLKSGHAYYCFCTAERLKQVRDRQILNKENPRYDGTCRRLTPEDAERRVRNGEPHVIRFRMPEEGSITVHDKLRGDITYENCNLDDTILVRTDGLPVYHLAAMTDDHLMKITHVIRTVEWLPTFPLHMHIIRAFGWHEPVFIHPSVFLKPSGKGKMSKRDSAQILKDGYSIFVTDLMNLGYIPEAVINWTALMGWSYDDRTEFFTLHDLIEKFDLDNLNPSPAAINFSKLDHFNGLHIRALPLDELARRLKPYFASAGYVADETILQKVAPLIQERMVTLDEGPQLAGFFFNEEVSPDPEELLGKGMSKEESIQAVRHAYELLDLLDEIRLETAEPPMRQLAENLGLKPGQLFGILRAAITGQKVSPPLFESMEIIGKTTILKRLKHAITTLELMA